MKIDEAITALEAALDQMKAEKESIEAAHAERLPVLIESILMQSGALSFARDFKAINDAEDDAATEPVEIEMEEEL